MGSLQHRHFRLMWRRCSRLLGSCVGATTHGLLSTPLLHLFALVWPNDTTGEVFICGPEKAKQSIEWNPKSYGLLPPCHFIRRHEAKHIYQEEVDACKFSPCAMHAKPKPPKVCMRACKTDRHTCKMAISLLSHLNGNIYLGKVNKRKWGQTRMQWTSFL